MSKATKLLQQVMEHGPLSEQLLMAKVVRQMYMDAVSNTEIQLDTKLLRDVNKGINSLEKQCSSTSKT